MSSLEIGKYFVIHSKHNFNSVLEVSDEGKSELVKVADLKPDWMGNNDHQLWYYNKMSNILFNKKDNLCLEAIDGKLYVKTPKLNNENQKWVIKDDWIMSESTNDVVEVSGGDQECQLKKKNSEELNQQWKFENLPILYFYIKLKSKPTLVVDVKGDDQKPGAKVIVYENKGKLSDNQLWWEDKNGVIRSKMNGFAFDLTDKKEVVLNPYQQDSENPNQQWVISGPHLRNAVSPNSYLYVKQGNVFTGPPRLNACDSLEGISVDDVQWELEFMEHQSISLNHSGCGRNFAIRSRQYGKMLEVVCDNVDVGAKLVLKKPDGDSSKSSRQHFYEDDVTGTIRSVLRNYAIEATDTGLILSSYDPYKKLQQWQCKDHKIQNRHNLNRVIQVNSLNSAASTAAITATSGTGPAVVDGTTPAVDGTGPAASGTDSAVVGGTGPAVDGGTGPAVDGTGGPAVIGTGPAVKDTSTAAGDVSTTAAGGGGGGGGGVDDDIIINVGEDVNGANQLWDFCYVPAKCFQISSVLCHKVIDVRGCNTSAGAPVILYERNRTPTKNQLWYEDEKGLLRSKLNGYVMDSSGPTVKVTPYDPSNPDHHWTVVGDRIQNKFDNKMVIDIYGENKRNGTSLIKYKFHGGENQRWKFEYGN